MFVTPDQEEALCFADRLAVMQEGHIEQIGTPETVYHRPQTPFVADFLGMTNLITGEAEGKLCRDPLGQISDRTISAWGGTPLNSYGSIWSWFNRRQ